MIEWAIAGVDGDDKWISDETFTERTEPRPGFYEGGWPVFRYVTDWQTGDCRHDSMSGDEGPVRLLGRMPIRWRCDECDAIVYDDTSQYQSCQATDPLVAGGNCTEPVGHEGNHHNRTGFFWSNTRREAPFYESLVSVKTSDL